MKLKVTLVYSALLSLGLIIIVLQYPFSKIEAYLYDLRVRMDINSFGQANFVIISLDEKSDKTLGELYPYSFSTHSNLLKNLSQQSPLLINYFVNFDAPGTDRGERELIEFKNEALKYQKNKGIIRFGTNLDYWGEQLPPGALQEVGHSLSLLNIDSSLFAKDDVNRRAIIENQGESSIHFWSANKIREKRNLKRLESESVWGQYEVDEFATKFALFRYFDRAKDDCEHIQRISLSDVIAQNYPPDFFKDKIVLIGPEYTSRSEDFIKTPFDRDEATISKLNVHAQIIHALAFGKTVKKIPKEFTNALALILACFLIWVISRRRPTKGLFFTLSTLLGVGFFSFAIFTFFGLFLYTVHIGLSILIVYYVCVPFRTIEEYQRRYKIQEEAKLLRRVDSLKQNFISLMSHDLKTPVAKIAGIVDILITQFQNGPKQKEHLRRISESTRELNKFITSILDLTKVESREISLDLKSKDLNLIVDEVVEKLRYEIEQGGLHIQTDLAALYPIEMDSALIARVLSNLVENAIKFSGENKEILIKTWDDDSWVYLSVQDHGRGIEENELENIFEKFYRIQNDANYQVKGSGLGLYLVKYFIELHQGEISVQSEFGKGTTFVIKLKNR